MNDLAARVAEALEELTSELGHADALIAEQQARIEALETEVTRLRARLEHQGAAA